jgi:propionate CoA-transferase
MSIAQAAKACGGIIMVQVERIVKSGTMHPKHVKVPCTIVDYVVVAEKPQMQTMVSQYNPSFSGEVKVPMKSIPPMPMSSDKLICRRAAMEVRPGAISLGIGIPQGIASIIAEEKADSQVILMSESGSIGGIPGVGGDFGSHWNAEASTEQPTHFNYYDGGGLDIAVFGLAETDPEGNCNASVFNGKVFGVGGFINVATNAKRTIIAGTFTAVGLKVKSGDGKLTIEKEGQFKKFLKQVAQISFSGPYAREIGQGVMFITERAVFELTPDGFLLTEIAPGIDLQKDVLDQMDFKPIISPDLKLMDAGIFSEVFGEGKLKNNLTRCFLRVKNVHID